jgi:hypothetical protein
MDGSTSWKQRIPGANFASLDDRERQILENQQKKWGSPLANHLIYARVPSIFHGAQGMWRGLAAAGRLEPAIVALLNRRVAILNGCHF